MVAHVDATRGDDIMLEILILGFMFALVALAVSGHALLSNGQLRHPALRSDLTSPVLWTAE